MTRVSIYGRYSNDLQNPLSIEDQIRTCSELVDREGWQVVETYTDPALSGFSILQRPGIQRLMRDAHEGKFDVVVAEGLDRISRDQEDAAGLYKRLTFLGIKIVTLQEGEVTSLHVGFKGTMNAVFLTDLKIKVKRGLRGRVVKGRSAGGNCYGYDVLRNLDDHGEIIRGERRINKDEAQIVERIFREYAAGRAPKVIATILNAECVPAPAGTKWAATTIYGNWQRGSGILNNELYIGQRVWNKVSYPKSPDTGEHVARINPAKDHVRVAAPELRIIDQELWDRVKLRQQQLRKTGTSREFWTKRRPRYLFSYLLKCGCCGNGMAKISKTHYGCSAVRNKGDSVCTNRRGVRQDELEATVMALLKDRLMDKALLEVFCAEYTAHINRLRHQHNGSVAGYKSELAKLQGRQKRIIKAVMDGYDTPGMKDESNAINAREQELLKLLSEEKEAPVLLHPKMADRYRTSINGLIEAMREKDRGQEAVQIVRSLIDRIEMTPDPVGEGLLINLYGDLAGIVKIATGKKEIRDEDEEALKHIRLMTGFTEQARGDFLLPLPLAGQNGCGRTPPASPAFHITQPKRRAGTGNDAAVSILQEKMVGPAGLEPATRPL